MLSVILAGHVSSENDFSLEPPVELIRCPGAPERCADAGRSAGTDRRDTDALAFGDRAFAEAFAVWEKK